MKILLLEDEAMLRSSIKEFLEARGSDVDDFFDGAQALAASGSIEKPRMPRSQSAGSDTGDGHPAW